MQSIPSMIQTREQKFNSTVLSESHCIPQPGSQQWEINSSQETNEEEHGGVSKGSDMDRSW